MSKYGSGLSSIDICKLELEEMEEILNRYNVSDEDKAELKGMVKEAYFQLGKAYATGRVLERHTKDLDFKTYMAEMMEEERKFPFDVDEE